MKKSLLFVYGLAMGLMFSSCQPQNGSPTSEPKASKETKPNLEEIKSIVMAMEDTLSMAYQLKDPNLFAKFYAEDAVTYGEGREQLFGKKEIMSHFTRNIVHDSTQLFNFDYQTIDVFAAGDIAVETGKWIERDSSDVEVSHGFYTVVFKKENGRYRSIRDIWNSGAKNPPSVPEAL